MATLHPFKALRPVPKHAQEVASVPYDVINSREARQLAEGKPYSFLHVIRPEIDIEEGIDEHEDAVYEKGAHNLRAYADSDLSVQDDEPSLYVYQLIMGQRKQAGIFGCVSVSEYDNGTILRHEKTRPIKEDDRTRHILTQQAHAEPVMLTFRDSVGMSRIIEGVMQGDALYDFRADDGVRHTIWKVGDPQEFVDSFARVEKLYVADGHHRCKAASRAAEVVRAQGRSDEMPEVAFFPAVLFPMQAMQILPYNRIIYSLPGDPEDFLKELHDRFGLEEVDDPTPDIPGMICLYLDGKWYRMNLPHSEKNGVDDRLDVARLNEHILEPILDITDVRTDKNIDFVGGIRGTHALEALVDEGKADLAISMYPTSIEELVEVSDAGLLMPPKSTWFEPKLRSGLLVHMF